jgi:hypothetical protein
MGVCVDESPLLLTAPRQSTMGVGLDGLQGILEPYM